MSVLSISNFSIFALGPNINNFRKKASELPIVTDSVRVSSADITNETFQTYVPPIRINTLAPQIPQNEIKFEHQPPHVQFISSSLPSTTSVLVNQAQALKAYGG